MTDVGAHSLRHTFVTIARMAGIPDPVICQITGHSSQEMVDHHTQFSEEMVASLAGRLLATEGTSAKALPQQSFAQQENVPDWIQEKIREIASRITGKRNEAIKAELLEMLNDGDG